MEATYGMAVTVTYTLSLDDGQLVGDEGRRLEYLHGYHNIVPGLEKALEGIAAGERRAIVLEPAEAYGEYDPERLVTVPVDSVPEGTELVVGARVTAKTGRGPVALTVSELKGDSVVLDANHPLAGKRLHFDVEAVDVRTATGRELRQGYPGTESPASEHCC